MDAVSILSTLKKYLTNGINFWVKDLVIQSNLRFFALNIRMSVPVMWMRTVIKKIHKIFLIAQSCHIQQRANFFYGNNTNIYIIGITEITPPQKRRTPMPLNFTLK